MSSSDQTEISMKPPEISPVPEGVQRPLWSVMIPTYNCAKYLRQTLESVLSQDPGPENMQIEVVDDCSTLDDPESVVNAVGKSRVAFYRKPSNEGAIANFNTCIERSRGHLVHILHGDDWVNPGFYSAIEKMSSENSGAALLSVRCFYTDQEGWYTGLTPRLNCLENCSKIVTDFYLGNPLQFAGVVIRRAFYEKHGGFILELAHTADWEMWTRAISRAAGIVSPAVLACYRIFEANDTGRLMRTAHNLVDRDRLFKLLQSRHIDFPVSAARKKQVRIARSQEQKFKAIGDKAAESANRKYWKSIANPIEQGFWALTDLVRRIC